MNVIDKALGTRLRDQREAHGITPEEIARQLEVCIEGVERIEVGLQRASARQLLLFCTLLEVTPTELYQGILDRHDCPGAARPPTERQPS